MVNLLGLLLINLLNVLIIRTMEILIQNKTEFTQRKNRSNYMSGY